MQEALPQFGRSQGEDFIADSRAITSEARTAVQGHMLLEAAAAEVSLNGQQQEVVQAVSVAAAYFEDTLESSPGVVLSAGSVSAQSLGAMLTEAGFGEMMDTGSRIRVREVVGEEFLTGQAVTSAVPKGWLSGVRGALRS